MSAPSAGADAAGLASRGGGRHQILGDGQRRAGERSGHAGHGNVEQPAPAVLECLEPPCRRGEAGEGVGDGIGAEHGPSSDQATSPPAAAASSPNPTRVPDGSAAAVAGDGDPEPRSAGHHVRGHDAELFEGAGRLASMTTSAEWTRRPSQGAMPGIVEIEGDGPLRPVEKVEEGGRTAARPVGPRGRLHLDHVRPRAGPGGRRRADRPTATRDRPPGGLRGLSARVRRPGASP